MGKQGVTKGKQIKPKDDKGKVQVNQIRDQLKQDEPVVRERLMELINSSVQDGEVTNGNLLKAIELFYRYAVGPAPHVVDDGEGNDKAVKDSAWTTLVQNNYYGSQSEESDPKDVTPPKQ